MTSLPDTSLPPANVPTRRRGLQNTPGWVSGLALAFVVACIILRTGLISREAGSKDESESIEQNFRAILVTKTAYAVTRPSSFTSTYGEVGRTSSAQHASDAVYAWRKITRSAIVHTSDWRRLALTLSLFNRPGVPEALSHISAARAVDAARLSKEKNRTARSRRAQAAEVTVAEENALWKALYGGKPIAADHVSALRTVIGRLNLGWFEHAALAQLYSRAGQKLQAEDELGDAAWSASIVVGYNSFEAGLLLLGVIGLLTLGLLFVLNRVSRKERRSGSLSEEFFPAGPATLAYNISYSPSFPIVPPLPSQLSAERVAPPPISFSYRARTVAFSVYLAVFMLIGLPLRLLRPLFENWSSGAVGRLNSVIEIIVYVPVVFIALWVLRRLAAAESAAHTVATWRETFRTLGMTSQRPLADIGVGTLNYVLLMPVFFAVSAFSQKIFERYHTPINPAQFDSMMAQNNVDRLLLLLITAVAAPIVEELMFRGVLYPALKGGWGKIGGAALSAAVFAIVHPTLPSGFLPIMLLGFVMALTYERRGSLLPNIIMHGIHNGLILLTVFFLFAR